MIHDLINRKGEILTSKCGLTVKIRGPKQPPDFTAWTSEVTCPDCKKSAASKG